MEPEKTPIQNLAEVAQVNVSTLSESLRANMPSMAISITAKQLGLGLQMEQHNEAFAALKRSMMPVAAPLFDASQIARIGTGLAIKLKPLASLGVDLSRYNFSSNIGDVIAKSLPFIEQIRKTAKRYAEIKDTSLEVYEREEKFYLKEYGLSVPYENFWKWFVREYNDFPIWEVFDAITYKSIANDYGRYIAETRHERIENQSRHFEKVSLPTPILVSKNNSPTVNRPLEYITSKEFREGNSVKHCTDLANNRFGYVWRGYPVYSGMALAIMESDAVPVQQRLDDPESTSQFLMVDTTIDGANFFDSYVEGFRKGLVDFEKDYASASAIIYGTDSNKYVYSLHNLYKHGPESDGIGWEWKAKSHNYFVTQGAFHDYGYYAGLCYSIDLLAKKHPHLSEAIYNCNNDDKPKTPSREKVPDTLFHVWKEKIDNNGRKPYYDEVIAALSKQNRIKEIDGELSWVTSDGFVSYCAGFIMTCINKGWINHYSAPKIKDILNNSFGTKISSATTFKQNSLYTLTEQYLKPFKNMRTNSK